MHRWFFANERELCVPEEEKLSDGDSSIKMTDPSKKVEEIRTTEWPFCVTYLNELKSNEYIGIVGNCDVLGNWDPQGAFILQKTPDTWKYEATIEIPRNIDIYYRYIICAYNPVKEELIVRYWETHETPRVIRTCQNLLKDCDHLGIQNDECEVNLQRAWATIEYYVHFKVFQAPFIWQNTAQKRLLYTRVTPMFPIVPERCHTQNKTGDEIYKSSKPCPESALPGVCNLLGTCNDFAFVDAGLISNATKNLLTAQPDYGMPSGPDDLSLFHLSISNFKLTLYKIDLFTFSYKAPEDEPPYYYGYGYIFPDQLVGSEGSIKVHITCASTHRPLLQMRMDYLLIKPLISFRPDMHKTYSRNWPIDKLPIDIGHRGAGKTYVHNEDTIRENTLYSINRAAARHADYVQIDVMLTSDRVPVVHNEHLLHVLHRHNENVQALFQNYDVFVFPMEQFTREQLRCLAGCSTRNKANIPFQNMRHDDLRKLRAYRFGSTARETTCEKLLHDQMPFAGLLEIMDESEKKVGFMIDLKWVQKDINDRWEGGGYRPAFDRNLYVDTILDMVMKNASNRPIIFCSYDCDICAMLRFKQNLYPVMLRLKDPDATTMYKDMRVNNVHVAMYTAEALQLYGIALHVNYFRLNSKLAISMRSHNLAVFAAGDDRSDAEHRKQMKFEGVRGVLYDRIDQLNQEGEELMRPQVYLLETPQNKLALKKLWGRELKKKCSYRTTSDDEADLQKERKRITDWTFCLCYSGPLHGNEYVAVVGNCPQLGCWNPKNAVKLYHEQHTSKYSRMIKIPLSNDVEYRYIICSMDPINSIFVVRLWETHFKPRIIHRLQAKPSNSCDQFGWQKDYRVERPCLTAPAHYVQFNVFKAPFTFTDYYPRRILYMKVTRRTTKNLNILSCEDDCDYTCNWYDFSEVCTLTNPLNNRFEDQSRYGTRCGPEDLVVFQVTVTHMQLTVYRFDFFTYPSDNPVTQGPRLRCGYVYVRPEQLNGSNGMLNLEVRSPYTEEYLFTLKVDYLIVKPYPYQSFIFDKTYARYWRHDKPVLEIGHRGCGRTYRLEDETIRENTLYSFNRAAVHGAHMVELDVMLTNDTVPIVQHNHLLKLLLHPETPLETMLDERDVFSLPMEFFDLKILRKMTGRFTDTECHLPVDAFTNQQLHELQTYRFANIGTRKSTTIAKLMDEQAPFTTLEKVLTKISSPKLGFNIEVKWVQLDDEGNWEQNGFRNKIDRNDYVDAILEVVLRTAGKRRIIFSSFDLDICTLIRCKQHLYPVMLLMRDPNDQLQYKDLRTKNFRHMVYTAQSMEFLGLGLHVNTILRDNWHVAFAIKRGLTLFCSFGPHETRKVRESIKTMGIHGVIYDRIDQAKGEGITYEEPYYILEDENNTAELKELLENELEAKTGILKKTQLN